MLFKRKRRTEDRRVKVSLVPSKHTNQFGRTIEFSDPNTRSSGLIMVSPVGADILSVHVHSEDRSVRVSSCAAPGAGRHARLEGPTELEYERATLAP